MSHYPERIAGPGNRLKDGYGNTDEACGVQIPTIEPMHEVVEDKKLCLNLGSGYRPIPGFVNIDNRDVCNPDKLWNIADLGLPFDDNVVDVVVAIDFLEHVVPDRVIFVVEEIWRVLKPGGKFEHQTPSTDGRGAWQDPTHRSWWNQNSWFYYMDDVHRNLYGIKAKFRGINRNVVTNALHKIIHVHGVMYAVKDG